MPSDTTIPFLIAAAGNFDSLVLLTASRLELPRERSFFISSEVAALNDVSASWKLGEEEEEEEEESACTQAKNKGGNVRLRVPLRGKVPVQLLVGESHPRTMVWDEKGLEESR